MYLSLAFLPQADHHATHIAYLLVNRCLMVGLVAGVAANAACQAREQSGMVVAVVAEATTVISTASELLGAPIDVWVDDVGDVYVLDVNLARVLVVSRDARITRTFGREGAGPGELRRPIALAVQGDTVRIIDFGNARMQLFSRAGEYLAVAPLADRAGRGPTTLRADGWVAAGTLGFDSTLVVYYDERAEVRGRLRELVVPAEVWRIREFKTRIARGEIPKVFRNVVRPVFAQDGGLWLVFESDTIIERYDAAGIKQWSRPLAVSEADAIRENFFALNRNEPDPVRLYSLSYVADAAEINGRLWLLLNMPESMSSVVVALDEAGNITHRLTFSGVQGASTFAVDPSGDRIYFAVSSEARLVAAPLPSLR